MMCIKRLHVVDDPSDDGCTCSESLDPKSIPTAPSTPFPPPTSRKHEDGLSNVMTRPNNGQQWGPNLRPRRPIDCIGKSSHCHQYMTDAVASELIPALSDLSS